MHVDRSSLMPPLAGVAILFVAIVAAGCTSTPPKDAAAKVNNKIITYAELDRQYQSQFAAPPKTNDDQTTIQKLEVLRTLIDNEIMLQRAEKLGLLATDTDVDAKFNELKAPYTQEEFQKQLKERNMTVEELKAQLRRDLSIIRLFNREITSKISITDQEISDYYNNNKGMFNLAEPTIHIAQILVTPQADPKVLNVKQDKATNEEQARKKIDMIRRRVESGDDFAMLATNYSEDPSTAQNGGDLGFIPESALDKVSPDFRRLVLSTMPGHATSVIHTSEGYRILKIISKEPAGQRELNDPKVQQNIRETLLNRKDQMLKHAYYEVARNETTVVNYYALSIAPSADKK
ncbi:MAG TPA: peptidylprolyl isomerase [Bryobacteraceae bacterium]|jgi:peptidyl-prolyl cis-trans isomerase SurA